MSVWLIWWKKASKGDVSKKARRKYMRSGVHGGTVGRRGGSPTHQARRSELRTEMMAQNITFTSRAFPSRSDKIMPEKNFLFESELLSSIRQQHPVFISSHFCHPCGLSALGSDTLHPVEICRLPTG